MPPYGDMSYIDGPKTGELSGGGVYRRRRGMGIIIPLATYTSIMQVEVTGILATAQLVIGMFIYARTALQRYRV